MPTLAELHARSRQQRSAPITTSQPNTAQSNTTNPPEAESTFKWALRQIAKPGAATAGFVGGLLAKDFDEGLSRASANLAGDRQDSFGDVLDEQGMEPGVGRSALGFAGDVVLDPLNLIPVGGIAKAAGAVGRGVGAVADAARGVPVAGKIIDATEAAGKFVKEGVGELFDPQHAVRDNPAYAQQRRLLDSERHAVSDNVFHSIEGRYKGTTGDERRAIQRALDSGEAPADSKLQRIWQAQRDAYAKQFDEAVGAKVLKPEQRIEDYAPRVLSGKTFDEGARFKDISARDRFAQKRTTASLDQAIAGGAEPDAARAAFVREKAGARAALNGRHYLRVVEDFGEQLPDELMAAANKGDQTAAQAVREAEELFREQGLVPLRDVAGEPALKDALGNAWVPAAIANDLAKIHMAAPEPGKFGQLVDRATAMWRTQATVLRPGFHATNLAGNVYNSLLGGQRATKLPQTFWQSMPGQKLPTVANIPGEALEAYLKRHGVSHVGSAFGDELTTEGLEAMLERQGKSAVTRPVNAYTRGMSKLGSVIENTSKRAYFLDQLQQRATKASKLTPRDLDEAMIATKDALFDYRELSDTDRKIRRAVPFWTWSRKNVPLQIKGSLSRPTVPATYAKAQNAIEDATEDEGIRVDDALRPDYMQRDQQVQLPFQLSDGSNVFLAPYLPPQDVNKIPLPGGTSPAEALAQIGSMLTPFAKVPIEIAQNKSFFSGRPLFNEELGLLGDRRPAPPVTQMLPRELAQYVPGLLEDPKTERYMSPALMGILHDNFLPFVASAGKVGAGAVDAENTSNPLAAVGFVGGPKLTARSPEQTKRDAKAARKQAVRVRQLENRQRKLTPLEQALLKRREQQP